MYMCVKIGTVLSSYQPEGSRFIRRPGRGLNLERPSFAKPSVDRDVKPLVQSFNHILDDRSRLMPVLWTVSPISEARVALLEELTL